MRAADSRHGPRPRADRAGPRGRPLVEPASRTTTRGCAGPRSSGLPAATWSASCTTVRPCGSRRSRCAWVCCGTGTPTDEQEFQAAVEELQDELHLVLQELRDVAGRLYPPLLDEAGLGPALREAAGRGPAPVRIDAPDERFGPDVEGAVYFAVLGCLPDEPRPARRGRRAPRRRRRRRARLGRRRPARLSSPTASDAGRHRRGRPRVERSTAGDSAAITVRIPCA